MYLRLSEKFLNRNLKRMKREAIKLWGEIEGKDDLLEEDLKEDEVCVTFKKGGDLLQVSIWTPAGYFEIDIVLDDEIMIEVADSLKHKRNKINRAFGV